MEDYNLTTGAICVYPNQVIVKVNPSKTKLISQVPAAVKWLKAAGRPDIPIASVATGFPAGQTPLKLRLEEIRVAVADGATEIDIVINRTKVY